MVLAQAEAFKPPVFKPNTTLMNRLENGLRRFLDVQAGSGWRDLRPVLSQVHGRLLDIGCGAQVYRDLIPKSVKYVGIDTIDAKDRFGYEVPDTVYFEGDDWGIEDGSFDTALCTEVLEHIAEPAPFLDKVYDCLRPGGLLILTVPFAARWHFIPYDYWRYTPTSLNQLLAAAGFVKVHVQARGNPLTVACYKVMALQLMLLFGTGAKPLAMTKRVVGLVMLPLLVSVSAIANLSMLTDWGDDCLGYTVIAHRN